MDPLCDIEIIGFIILLFALWVSMAISNLGLYGSRNDNTNPHSVYYNAFWGTFIILGILLLAIIIIYRQSEA